MNRQSGLPRSSMTYRQWRRNHSDMNRDTRDWFGMEATKTVDHPPLVKVVSKKGEVSYRELWD